eukprot:5228-Pyramimonas_sp.AAC.1
MDLKSLNPPRSISRTTPEAPPDSSWKPLLDPPWTPFLSPSDPLLTPSVPPPGAERRTGAASPHRSRLPAQRKGRL